MARWGSSAAAALIHSPPSAFRRSCTRLATSEWAGALRPEGHQSAPEHAAVRPSQSLRQGPSRPFLPGGPARSLGAIHTHNMCGVLGNPKQVDDCSGESRLPGFPGVNRRHLRSSGIARASAAGPGQAGCKLGRGHLACTPHFCVICLPAVSDDNICDQTGILVDGSALPACCTSY